MLALMLVEAGLRPSFLIGADVNEIGTNAVWDAGEWLVLEADESYGTFLPCGPRSPWSPTWSPTTSTTTGPSTRLAEAFDRFLAGAGGPGWSAPTTRWRRRGPAPRGGHGGRGRRAPTTG